MKSLHKIVITGMLLAMALTACGTSSGASEAMASPSATRTGLTVSYSLTTGIVDGKMVFIGVGGEIDGVTNPTLRVDPGHTLQISLNSGEGAEHDISFPDFNATSGRASANQPVTLIFLADRAGVFVYYCTLPGHRQAGMEGKLQVGESGTAAMVTATPLGAGDGVSIVRDPIDLPAPIGDRGPQTIRLDLETLEVTGQLASGTSYTYWTFGGKVPGPFLRVRLDDTVEVHLRNSASSMMIHSVDFHAVTGPGGGAVMTQTPPGGETTFTFKALNPGLYVYHCATPMVAEHISNGMYGLILVEPEGGLSRADHEFYIMQGELYTREPFGTQGHLTGSIDNLLNEMPEYYLFNGAVGALTDQFPLHAKVGETVRIFFGVGGPNKVSSFHLIGEIWDRVYDQASLTTAPLTDVQTTLVPPGGATMVEFKLQVPGRYILVDHALSRLQRGLVGYLIVDGPPDVEIYSGTPAAGGGH